MAAVKKPSPYFAHHYYKSENEVPVTVKECKMDETMKAKALQAGKQMLMAAMDEKTMAGEIKHIFQQQYGGSWHCVVGRVYSSSITSSSKHFIYMYVGYEAILLFKSP